MKKNKQRSLVARLKAGRREKVRLQRALWRLRVGERRGRLQHFPLASLADQRGSLELTHREEGGKD